MQSMPYPIASILMRGQPSGGYIGRTPSSDGLIHSTAHPASLGHFSVDEDRIPQYYHSRLVRYEEYMNTGE
jgi:hypothetical protein